MTVAVGLKAGGTQAEQPSGVTERAALRRPSIRVQVAGLVVAAIAITVLALQAWNYLTAVQQGIGMARQQHLVIARNLAEALSRYASDVTTVFRAEALRMSSSSVADPEASHLEAFDFTHVYLLDKANTTRRSMDFAQGGPTPPLPSRAVLDVLWNRIEKDASRTHISGIHAVGGARAFYVATLRPDGLMALGFLDPRYVKKVQQAVAFGTRGHSAIVDQEGRVIAHPAAELERKTADLSKLTIVKQMLDRQTGVTQFYSPVMQAEMVAGFTFVPETGWGIMVPQPIGEISEAAHQMLHQSNIVAALVAVLLGLLGWLAAGTLVRPISQFTEFAHQVSGGDLGARTPAVFIPSRELKVLDSALGAMVTKVRDADGALREALRIEETANRKKSLFMAMVAHEMRTPLNGVIGMLDVCREQTTDEDADFYLATAQRSANELLDLTQQIMAFSVAEKGQLDISYTDADAGELVENVVAGLMGEAEAKQLMLTTVLPPAKDRLLSLPVPQIRQILKNLLDNAIKYSNSGVVTVALTVRKGRGATAMLELAVKDQGIGIASRDIAQIFEDFYQVDMSSSRRHGGLGIGLAVVKRQVERLRGEISCSSEVGIGSVFSVTIPVFDQAKADGGVRHKEGGVA